MSEKLANILDECIDRLLRGESLEQCLQRYPEQAAQLEPLLRIALAAQQTSAVEPRPEFKVQAQQQLASVLYRSKPKAQPRRIPLLDFATSRLREGIERLGSRPVWQKALASVLVVALIISLCLVIPVLLQQPPVAQAEEIGMEDPGVQVLLEEKGFDPSTVNTTVVRAGEKNVYKISLVDPKNGTVIGTVTVDIKEKTVTRVILGENGEEEEYVQPLKPAAVATLERIIEIARKNNRVKRLLDNGATVDKLTYLFSSQKKVVCLELLLGKRTWLVKIDLEKEEANIVYLRSNLNIVESENQSQVTANKTAIRVDENNSQVAANVTLELASKTATNLIGIKGEDGQAEICSINYPSSLKPKPAG